MHLLNASTLQLETFTDDDRPKYAILSHRWQFEEVTFRDIEQDTGNKKKGFSKLRMACKRTLWDGLGHIWIDTCCIDKSSSAELSEAINSMYQWYAGAERCYVYLFDVSSLEPGMDRDFQDAEFARSSWFTRSWTLQELVAPQKLTFYDRLWKEYGTKDSLLEALQRITGISFDSIRDLGLEQIPVSTRMRWAAGRSATRKEDIAYSLMGLFDVNMPMLYGEGEKAFLRLQQEIIRKSTDRSILLWMSQKAGTLAYVPNLAGSPLDFESQMTPSHSHLLSIFNNEPFALTSAGLEISVHLLRQSVGNYLALLSESLDSLRSSENYVLHLRLIRTTRRRGTFAQISAFSLGSEAWFSKADFRLDIPVTIVRCLKQDALPTLPGCIVTTPAMGTQVGELCEVQQVKIEGRQDSQEGYWVQPHSWKAWLCSVSVTLKTEAELHNGVTLRYKIGFDFWSRPVWLIWKQLGPDDILGRHLDRLYLSDIVADDSATTFGDFQDDRVKQVFDQDSSLSYWIVRHATPSTSRVSMTSCHTEITWCRQPCEEGYRCMFDIACVVNELLE